MQSRGTGLSGPVFPWQINHLAGQCGGTLNAFGDSSGGGTNPDHGRSNHADVEG